MRKKKSFALIKNNDSIHNSEDTSIHMVLDRDRYFSYFSTKTYVVGSH